MARSRWTGLRFGSLLEPRTLALSRRIASLRSGAAPTPPSRCNKRRRPRERPGPSIRPRSSFKLGSIAQKASAFDGRSSKPPSWPWCRPWAKCASALVRAFLAMLALELEDMVIQLVRRPSSPAFMAIVGRFAWNTRLTSSVPLQPLGPRARICPCRRRSQAALDQIEGVWPESFDPTNLFRCGSRVSWASREAHSNTTIERLVAMIVARMPPQLGATLGPLS